MNRQAKEQQTCDQLINGELKSTLSYMHEMWDVYTGQEEPTDEISEETFHEYGLSFDYVAAGTFEDQDEGYFRYQLSWGGPSSEFRFFCDAELHCYKIRYHYMDWFDGAERTLYDDDKTFMLEILEHFNEMGVLQSELDKAID